MLIKTIDKYPRALTVQTLPTLWRKLHWWIFEAISILFMSISRLCFRKMKYGSS